MTDEGRVLALDLGDKRIGVAVSDPTRLIARSHSVLERRSRKEDFEQIAQIIADEAVSLVVVGLPIPLSGVEGDRVAWTRDYATDLGNKINAPIVFWDESFSTIQAEASLRARGKSARQQRDWIDAVAAAIILQDFLDAHATD